MATTKTQAPKAEAKTEPTPAPEETPAPASTEPDLSGDIDDRMARLLKDHQRMGARPK